jgi:hypothetical protein
MNREVIKQFVILIIIIIIIIIIGPEFYLRVTQQLYC